MTGIRETFEELRKRGRCALIPYFMALYPDAETFRALLLGAQEAGASLIEVGIPFSDPIADGPAIQEAGQVALSNGATLTRILSLLSDMTGQITVPLAAMSYANVILRYGLDRFFAAARSAGIKGVIIPDLIVEETPRFKLASGKNGIDLIQFVAPTTPKERLRRIASAAQGFLYLVSVTGVTGARPGRKFNLAKYVNSVRETTNIPLCVGFGIATPAQAASVAKIADGVIIGSALLDIIKSHRSNAPEAVTRFLRKIASKLHTKGA